MLPAGWKEKGLFGDTPERCLSLVQKVDRLHLIFDPANYLQCGVDPLEAYRSLECLIDYIHVKDALKNGQTMPAGQGDCRLPEILSRFLGKKDNPVLALEPHLAVFDGLSSLELGEKDFSCTAAVRRHQGGLCGGRLAFVPASGVLPRTTRPGHRVW